MLTLNSINGTGRVPLHSTQFVRTYDFYRKEAGDLGNCVLGPIGVRIDQKEFKQVADTLDL